jgi:two-component system cell cycle response regulator
MKILVAEDEAISRVMLARALRRSGYDIIEVEDGVQALQALKKEEPPRLALLDWMMPYKDGAQVCREVRSLQGRAYTYLILLSSKESKREIVQGLEAGADDYLTKPFDPEELKARLRSGVRILELEDRLVQARESMRFQATHDQLTSLWNRAVIVDLATREILRSRRERHCTAVMLCDIDHFKQVNDKFGHAAGDQVLREVARRMQDSARSYDIVGRYGGEEFLMILNKCEPANAQARAESIRIAISEKLFVAPPRKLQVSISIGLAFSTDCENCSVDEIIQEADKALYAAKEAGRNRVKIARPERGAEGAEVLDKEITLQNSR